MEIYPSHAAVGLAMMVCGYAMSVYTTMLLGVDGTYFGIEVSWRTHVIPSTVQDYAERVHQCRRDFTEIVQLCGRDFSKACLPCPALVGFNFASDPQKLRQELRHGGNLFCPL